MFERINQKIENLKNDKSSFKKYVKCFCDINSVKEFFKKDKEFIKLSNSVSEKKPEKDIFYD